MKKQGELLKHSEYVRELKPLLPAGAFKRNPRKLFGIGFHLILIACCLLGFRYSDSFWLFALMAMVMGHSITCLGRMALI